MLRPLAAVCLFAAVWLSSGWAAPATSADPPLTFEAEASAVTVDVVVEGPDGLPVCGLSREDFLVLEDGRAQTIVGFEARDTRRHDVSAETSRAPASLVGASNWDPERQPRRVFALLVDDLGLSALAAERVKAVVDGWLRAGAQPLDEITIVTTSGDVFWSDLAGDGLPDLLLALARVRGKAFPPGSGETMSDFEAYRVAVFEESTEGLIDPLARSRPPDVAGTVRAGLQGNMFFVSTLEGQSIVERVTQRWIRSHVCPPCVDPAEMSADCVEIRACRQRVQSRAREQHSAWRRRVSSLHDSVSRLARALSGAPGRKAILLVSEELLEDTSLPLTRRTADACQRANAVLYFLGGWGLTGSSLFSAEADAAPRPQDVGATSREEGFLAVAGGVALAEETGGLALTSNDLATGLSQMASDSSSYYLLGFQSDKAPDDRWRSLKVQVKRPGARVRARPRYLAAATQELRPAGAKQKKTERSLDPALLAGISRGELPVRMTGPYTLQVVAYQPQDGRASIRTSSFEVPSIREGQLALSSVAVLERVERLTADERGKDNPLYFDEAFLYPNLGEPLSKSVVPAVGFCFTVYPAAQRPAPVKAIVEVLRDAQPVSATPLALGAPDVRGRIQQAAAFGAASLAPGDYTLRIQVGEGQDVVTQEARFVLRP